MFVTSVSRIATFGRIDQIRSGNFDDRKALRDGVWELRVDVGLATASTTEFQAPSGSASLRRR